MDAELNVEEVIEQLSAITEWLEVAGEDYYVSAELAYQLLEEIKTQVD
jgi:hypothetical protein